MAFWRLAATEMVRVAGAVRWQAGKHTSARRAARLL
jgi:hypothetical protein